MTGFSFGNLSLSGVTAAAGISVLAPGKYVCKVKEAVIEDTKNKGGKVLKVKLACDSGVITANINVFNPSAEAQRIGLEQLKALLVFGGHPDPDNIGQHGVQSIRGLTVGVVVSPDSYNGQPSSKVSGFMKPEDVPAGNSTGPAASAPIGGSKLPF